MEENKIENKIENDVCIICLEEVEFINKKKNFHCDCKLKIHIKCYNDYFLNNNYKCLICKQIDFKYIFDDIYSKYLTYIKDYKQTIKIFKINNETEKLENLYI